MIGDVLKRLRGIYGYKAAELSSMLGISASYLSELEHNKKQPSYELLNKYAHIFGIKLSSLILLSESYEEAMRRGKGIASIQTMMLRLISKMSSDSEEADQNEQNV